MKKILLPAAFALSSAFMGSAYAATATTTLDVVALVGLTCNVTTTPVDFGVVDPVVLNETTGAVTVTCPSGTPYNIALDAGKNFDGFSRALSNGLDTLTYGLGDPARLELWGDSDYAGTFPDGTSTPGTGTGAPYTHIIDGFLDPAASAVSDGVYTDVVNVTVYY